MKTTKKTEFVRVRVEPHTKREVDRLAKKTGRTEAGMLRRIVEVGLNEYCKRGIQE